MEEHEDPYIVAGNRRPLEPGHAFSIEPGIYVAGRWGMRLEDIVVATADGPDALEHASDHALVGRSRRTRRDAIVELATACQGRTRDRSSGDTERRRIVPTN